MDVFLVIGESIILIVKLIVNVCLYCRFSFDIFWYNVSLLSLFLLMGGCATWRSGKHTINTTSVRKADTSVYYANFKAYFTEKGYINRQQLLLSKNAPPLYKDTTFTRRYYAFRVQELLDTMRCVPMALLDSSLWTGTPNFGLRTPNFIILHHTAQSNALYTLYFFARPDPEVSAHYLIAKNGTIYPIVQDYFRAWHAGIGRWGSITNMNSISIGIELDNAGEDSFPQEQIKSLLALLTELTEKYNIPFTNILGHADIAPGRKKDPNHLFPWKTLAEQGFGIWYEDDTSIRKVPPHFDPLLALRVIGYDVSNPYAAFISFRRHFIGSNVLDKSLSSEELRILYLLYKQYLSLDLLHLPEKK